MMLLAVVAGVAVASLLARGSGSGSGGVAGGAVDAMPPVVGVPQLSQLLAAIRLVEGTSGPDGYRTLYGQTLFDDYSAHPSQLGWEGVGLSDDQCSRAGRGPGCRSYAAGAYQINKTTWATVQRALSLPDFGPDSQDRAAAWLLADAGALGVPAADAVAAMAPVWDGFNAQRWASGAGAAQVAAMLA